MSSIERRVEKLEAASPSATAPPIVISWLTEAEAMARGLATDSKHITFDSSPKRYALLGNG